MTSVTHVAQWLEARGKSTAAAELRAEIAEWFKA